MKKRVTVSIIVLFLLFMIVSYYSCVQANSAGTTIHVVLAYNSGYLRQAPHILAAYESVLQEEGVPYESAEVSELIRQQPDKLAKTVPAVILPDNLLQHIPSSLNNWLKEYLAAGGNVAVINDVGIKNESGYFLSTAALADIIGLNYITYELSSTEAFTYGHIKFASTAKRDFFQFPSGKTIDGLTISSYSYGALNYPLSRNTPIRTLDEDTVYAYGITEKNEKIPAIVLTNYDQGKVLYVNLPLGYLKAYSDDLPLRSVLRTFLFDTIGIMHVMNVENGKGGIVLNWHLDSEVEHIASPYLMKHKYFRKELASSFHITAGDFFVKPGDGLGFDASDRGKSLVMRLKEYGTIGSHGGWAHNWFSDNINKGTFKEAEIREYIKKNNDALEKITGYKVLEYSAPVGTHPQPVTTKILEDLGLIAYYYTGDTGSSPNRVFHQGTMVSNKVIAFPIMPFGNTASIGEASLAKKTDSEVSSWFTDTLNYVSRNRTIRLIYSHPYDIKHYPSVFNTFFDKLVTMQASGDLAVHPMSEFAQYFLRFLQTTYTFSQEEQQIVISLANPKGLQGVTIAVPKKVCQRPVIPGTSLEEDDRYYYLTLEGTYESTTIKINTSK